MIHILVLLFYLYLLLGLFFGLWFVFRGVQKIDPGMANAKWSMRMILLPGSLALWPVLLRKYLRRKLTA
jgi:uncharacterized membrane protein YphA (DoxX/SURF4 family)